MFALRGMAPEPPPSTRRQPKPGDENRQQQGPNNRPSFDLKVTLEHAATCWSDFDH